MSDFVVKIIGYLLRIPGIIFVFSFKGFYQSYIATKLGDPTPRNAGRLTINPSAHIDPIGFLFMLIFRIGWTKPIPVRTRNFKKVKRDIGIYYISGPLSCIIGGFIMYFFYALSAFFLPFNTVTTYIALMFLTASSLSVFLGFFHLLPLPGLDGYNFLANFLPYKYNNVLYNIERYSTYIFIGFILLMQVTPIGSILIGYPASLIMGLFNLIFSFLL